MRKAVLVLVKHPEPGRVKTRLAATVGLDAAASIYRRLALAVFGQIRGDAEIVAVFDPPEKRAEIEGWLGNMADHFIPQVAGDLGCRIDRAFTEAFSRGYERVAVVGTDCVEIDGRILDETWAALHSHEMVLGPTEDGGYYLLALNGPCPALFKKIPWSTPAVCADTLARAAKAKLRVHLLPKLRDVDTEEDWHRASSRQNL